jgi:hypothetical protein
VPGRRQQIGAGYCQTFSLLPKRLKVDAAHGGQLRIAQRGEPKRPPRAVCSGARSEELDLNISGPQLSSKVEVKAGVPFGGVSL